MGGAGVSSFPRGSSKRGWLEEESEAVRMCLPLAVGFSGLSSPPSGEVEVSVSFPGLKTVYSISEVQCEILNPQECVVCVCFLLVGGRWEFIHRYNDIVRVCNHCNYYIYIYMYTFIHICFFPLRCLAVFGRVLVKILLFKGGSLESSSMSSPKVSELGVF